MAKRKHELHKYYVCYEKQTGKIIALTNEPSKRFKHLLEVPEDLYCKFMSKEEPTAGYTVGYLKSDDGQTVLSLIPKTDQAFIFKNTYFEWISDKPTDKTELTVTWNGPERLWEFELSKDAATRIGTALDNTLIPFFIILEHDFDFLIRTIMIDPMTLFKSKIRIPFEDAIEGKIDKISVATRLALQSYGLKIND